MDTPDDFVKLRRYSRQEAAAMLGIYDSWLKKWVTARCIPHQRSGRTRGVWFTYDDVVAIGRLLPSLMTGTQANGRAEGRAFVPPPSTGQGGELVVGRIPNTPTDDVAELFGSLRSLRSS